GTLCRLTLGSLLLACTANAAWPPGGLIVLSPWTPIVADADILQAPGGDLFVLGVGRCLCNDAYFVVQRVSVGGVLASGWPTSGVDFGGVLSGVSLDQQSFFVDDASRLWHAWAYISSSLRAIAGVGTLVPATATAYDLGSS